MSANARRPCAAWRDDGRPSEDGGGWELDLATLQLIVEGDGRVDDAKWWKWEIVDTDGCIVTDAAQGKARTAHEAKFAAEDEAIRLLEADLAVLRGAP